jgi:transcriptional regulator GlxA family with amidase domain
MSKGARRIVILVYDGIQSLDLTGPLEVFGTANRHLVRSGAAAAYSLEVVAPRGGIVTGMSGLRIAADRSCAELRGPIDTLVVAGGDVRSVFGDRAVLRWLARASRRVRRLASVCTGAFLLAEAGVLDGRRATTHWGSVAHLARRYPQLTVEPDLIFVRDGNVYTSAGVTAGIDLALALVEDDLGHEVALAVARQLVVFLKRPGGQSQFSSALAAQAVAPGPLKGLPEWIVANLRGNLSVEALAARAAMSPRHFARVFKRETGATPARAALAARVEAARRRLEDGDDGLEGVAAASGFGSAEVMRRAFLRTLRVGPAVYRRRFRRAS